MDFSDGDLWRYICSRWFVLWGESKHADKREPSEKWTFGFHFVFSLPLNHNNLVQSQPGRSEGVCANTVQTVPKFLVSPPLSALLQRFHLHIMHNLIYSTFWNEGTKQKQWPLLEESATHFTVTTLGCRRSALFFCHVSHLTFTNVFAKT